jgi:hypothetical protein
VLPCTGERGQHGDGASCGSAIVAALYAVVDADDCWRGGGVVVGEAFDVVDRDAGQGGNVVGWIFSDALAKLIEAAGPASDVVLIVEVVADDDVHHAKRERGVGAGIDGDVPVRGASGAGGVGVDDDELCAIAPRFFDEGPEMDVVAVDVCGPGDDELRLREGFGIGAEFAAVDRDERLASGFRADGAVELRGAKAMEEASIHRAVIQDADGAGVGVGQDRFGSVLAGDGGEAGRDGREGFIPGDALEGFRFASMGQRSFGDAGATAHGVEETVGRVDAVEVFRYFTAEKAAGDGMVGVAAEFGRLSGLVDGDEDSTGVGAVVGADGMDCPGGHRNRVQGTGCRVQGNDQGIGTREQGIASREPGRGAESAG